MKGYFASLAKQSGLRISGQGRGARVSPGIAYGRVPEPLHREETVLVPPPVANSKSGKAAGPGHTQKAETPKVMREGPTAGAQPPKLIEKAEKITRAEEGSDRREPAKDEAVSRETTVLQDIRDNTDHRPSVEERVSPDHNPEIITVIEQQKFVEQEGSSKFSTSRPDNAESPQTVSTGTVETPRFFAKTAQILERGEADVTDIGSIIFEEVRQWVASGPSETEEGAPHPQAVETVTVRDIHHSETEPGTVVIRDRADRKSRSEPAALEEQNFSLSIGTISVIIEDPDTPPEPVRVIQNDQAQSTRAETKREFSRLSRNYL